MSKPWTLAYLNKKQRLSPLSNWFITWVKLVKDWLHLLTVHKSSGNWDFLYIFFYKKFPFAMYLACNASLASIQNFLYWLINLENKKTLHQPTTQTGLSSS